MGGVRPSFEGKPLRTLCRRMQNLKRRRAGARVPTYASCKIFKIHTRVFTGAAEPVCRNVAEVYYILDVSLSTYPTGRESPDEKTGEKRGGKSNRIQGRI